MIFVLNYNHNTNTNTTNVLSIMLCESNYHKFNLRFVCVFIIITKMSLRKVDIFKNLHDMFAKTRGMGHTNNYVKNKRIG